MMSLLAVFLFILSYQIIPFHAQITGDTSSDIDPYETLVWGPGLQPEKAVFRSRYIFLQLRNSDSKKFVFYYGFASKICIEYLFVMDVFLLF